MIMKSIIHYICIRILPLIAILLLPSVTASGQRYETKALRKGVMTLRTSLDGSRRNDFPLMALGGDGLTFSLDEIDGGERNYK